MSLKYLQTSPTIELTTPLERHLFQERDSNLSSNLNIEFKSFNAPSLLQTYLQNFRPDSPRTQKALKVLGLQANDMKFWTKDDFKGIDAEIAGMYVENKNFRLLKIFKELHKKRKEVSSGFKQNTCRSPIKLDEISKYFKKRFYSPEQKISPKMRNIDKICGIEENYKKIKVKFERAEIHNDRIVKKLK